MRLLGHGLLPLREVMEYAIGYARDGYPMLATASATIDAVSGLFRGHWPTSAEIYLDGGVPAPGARFTNKPLADCYTRLGELNLAEEAYRSAIDLAPEDGLFAAGLRSLVDARSAGHL
jgi:gamma-glutamyltranspeptidase/glutathione hydrolase